MSVAFELLFMDDHTIEHLKLMQAVVTRLAQNSFAIKGWAVALVAAIFVVANTRTGPNYFLIALLPTLAFWGLDAYYLRQERLFRKLYDSIRTATESEMQGSLFSMDTSPYNAQVPTWWATCWSKTIAWLYGPIALLILVLTIVVYIRW